jgi:murein DD-endopeptidase MepM/ murein hydrolase activator NlpD
MFEREIDIFFYHGRHGVRRLFTYRRWMLLAAVGLLAVSAGGGGVLWHYYAGYEALFHRTGQIRAHLAEQKALALVLRERVRRAALEMERIEAFDAKLGVMLTRPGELEGKGALRTAVDLPVSPGRRLFDFLDALAGRMAVEEAHQQELARWLSDRKLEFLAKPSLWPARGTITSDFGPRVSPFGRGGDFHKGVDIRMPTGTPVFAPGAGRVIETGYMHGYGLRVVIAHDFGLETIFAHLKKAEVEPGQTVKRGQRIGLSGNSGRTTGSHLHYEVHANGTPVNPVQYMLD